MIAGANGAGKSTYTSLMREGGADIIDPDALARERLLTRIGAGRAALSLARSNLAAGSSFGVETTLAGEGPLRLMRLARARSFEVELAYLGTDDMSINLRRIAERVSQGGHHVDEIDVRRRYGRSLANLPAALALADRWALLDTSGDVRFRLFAVRDNFGTRCKARVPAWAQGLDLA